MLRTKHTSTIFRAAALDPSTGNKASRTFTIGGARRKDVAELARILLRNIEDVFPQSCQEIQRHLGSTSVVHHKGRVVAAASLRVLDEGTCELRGLIVAKPFRGFGLAGRLVKRLIRQSRRSGRGLICVTRHPNFFQRFGFRRLPRKGEEPGHRPERGSRVEMVLPIAVPRESALVTQAQRVVERQSDRLQIPGRQIIEGDQGAVNATQ